MKPKLPLKRSRRTWSSSENEVHILEEQISDLKNKIAELQGQTELLKEAQHMAICRHEEEKKQLQMKWMRKRLTCRRSCGWNMRWHSGLGWSRWRKACEKLIQNGAWTEEKVRGWLRNPGTSSPGAAEKPGGETHSWERGIAKELLEKHQRELHEGR